MECKPRLLGGVMLPFVLAGALASCAPDVERTGSIRDVTDRGHSNDPALRAGLERMAERQRNQEMAALAPRTEPQASAPEQPPEPVQVARALEPVPERAPTTTVPEAPAPEVRAGPDTPMDCLPAGLRRIVDETARRFGPVEVVSTTHLHTGNHNAGRAKIHADCKAVDIRTQASPAEVVAFVRTLPGLGGVGSYKNGVIHLDDASAHPPNAYAKRSREGADDE